LVVLAGVPYRLLKRAVPIHPTLTEEFRTLIEEVKPVKQQMLRLPLQGLPIGKGGTRVLVM
jgi:hypothetical protein